jgi:hypothetical protein
MCLILQSEVILANVLSQDENNCGINREGLAQYCIEVKNALAKTKRMDNEYIYFDLEEQSLQNAFKAYYNHFLELGDKIYSNKKINLEYFNSRFSKSIAETLKSVAQKNVGKLCTK